MKKVLSLVLALAALPGCLSRTVSDPIRYFRPGIPREAPSAPPARPAAAEPEQRPAPLQLRLRRVGAVAYLRERIARRASDVEVSFSDLQRWTEPPVGYVERALVRELFEARAITRTESGGAPHLDVELRSFEEALEPSRAAVVVIWVSLADGREAPLLERPVSSRAPVEGRDPADLARAMGVALEQAVRDVGREVEAALRKAKK